MRIPTTVRAALASYARTFLGAVLAAYTATGGDIWSVDRADVRTIISAGVGALVVTAVNALRPGETRYGVGAERAGMGGEDVTEPPAVVGVDGTVTPLGAPAEPAGVVDPLA